MSNDDNKQPAKNLKTLQGFKEAAAAVFLRMSQKAAATSYLRDDLIGAGIAGELKPVADTFAVEVTVPDSEWLPRGVEDRNELSAAAASKYEAAALAKSRHAVWARIKRMSDLGRITGEEVTQALLELGYPKTVHPQRQTAVSAYVSNYSSDNEYNRNDPKHVPFSIPGEAPDEAQVRAALAAGAVEAPQFAAIRKAFPHANGLPELVTEFEMHEQSVWPDYTEK